MPHTHRAMIIPAADRDTARKIWGTLDPEYADTFRFACGSAADPESKIISHYCDAGPITEAAALLMPLEYWTLDPDTGFWVLQYRDDGNPKRVYWFCKSKGAEFSLEQIEGIWARASVSEQSLDAALARAGLRIIWPEAPESKPEQAPGETDDGNN